MARKNKGKEKRITRSIRIEPKRLAVIAKKHGTFQKWLDIQIEKEESGQKTRPEMTKKEKSLLKKQISELISEMF